ncbi:MAG: hypothetical protein OXD46_08035 [Chloroflexi bacterium]|nr:hypothetical protein [Chloroflexota bacterium]
MKLEVLSYENGKPIPGEFAFCVPADEGHVLAQASWVGTYTLNPAVEV